MFKKRLKLDPDHKILIQAIADKFGMTFEQAGYIIMEKGFVLMRLLTESDERIIQGIKLYKDSKDTMKVADTIYEWWEAGREEQE